MHATQSAPLPGTHTRIPATPAVCLTGMTVGYDKTPILADTNLEIPWGQLVGVLGPNGAGKSTLIKTILGTLRTQAGTVEIGGYPTHTREARNLIGYVPQREAVNWDFPVTVYDVVMMGRTARLGWLRFPGAADRHAVLDALKQVDMTGFSHRQISQLSGGQQQRVFLARALAQGGRLLLLDEPLNGVDATTQETIGALLRRVRDTGGTVIMATHDIELAAAWCDRLIMVNHALIAYGTPAEALRPDPLRLTYGGQVLVVPTPNGADGAGGAGGAAEGASGTSTIVPDAHGHPGGHPAPGTHTKIL